MTVLSDGVLDPSARVALDDPPATGEVALRLAGLHKRLGGRDIVADLDLDVAAGELVTLLGPSGCGKTTTLRMIAGFLAPDAGRVIVSGRDVTALSPEDRPSAMVFQSYALWPHMTVFKNVAFPLKLAKVGKAETTRRVEAALDMVGLMHHRDSRPSRISGGEQQRVALARALVQEPKLLLLDEPLSNLDARLRVRVREEIREIQQRLGITTILVTHDQEEALSISDRVAVMKDGRIEQLSPPSTLYADPDSEFVATFVGSLNRYEGRFEGNRFTPATAQAAGSSTTAAPVVTGVRPEDVLISERADIGDLGGRGPGDPARPVRRGGAAARRARPGPAGVPDRFGPGDRRSGRRTAAERDDVRRREPGALMTLIVAHRGDSAAYRENTLTAFASAIDLGAHRVELDVRTTADGVSIVLHDPTLLRVWGVDAVAGDLTWAQVAAIGYADLRIPRLLDALKLFVGTGVGVLVDVLTVADARAAWAVVEPLEAAGADLEVHWCGEAVAMAEVRRLSPGAIVYLATNTGTADGAALMSLRPTYLNMEGDLATPSVVAEAHAMGLGVSVWTIDEAAAMRYLLGIGVDAITTNEIRTLREVIATPGPAVSLAEPPDAADPVPTAPTELELARDLGGWAASYLRAARPEGVTTKAHAADFVTSVDRDVERRVREVIGATFPDHVVVGEEEGGAPAAGRPAWYVDPVDGTTNYAHGLGWSSFSLALAVDREPRLGVIADPWRREVLWGVVGMGAYAAGAPLVATGPADGAGALLLTEWAAHAPWPGMLELVGELAAGLVTPRIMGSGTLSLANVAAGRAAAAVIGDFNPIDHLAGVILAAEAGALVFDAAGQPSAFPGPGPFLVTAPECADLMRTAFLRHCVRRT